jgi:hypothetical protein
MFKGTYTDKFYRAIRDALHAEVESWRDSAELGERVRQCKELWSAVEALEPVSRNSNPTELPEGTGCEIVNLLSLGSHFVSVQAVPSSSGDVNE